MIRVAILDHHSAMRAGLDAILRAAAGIVPVGAAADGRELWPLLYRSDPDVVLLDDLRACLAVRGRYPHMRLVAYAAAPPLVAAFAGADAAVDKAAGVHELLAALRGERALGPITPRAQRQAAARLEASDRAILAMRLAGTPDREIAAVVVGLPRAALAARYAELLAALVTRRPDRPATGAGSARDTAAPLPPHAPPRAARAARGSSA
jgi:DNA-binding NarL/FixJ family response regulator